MSSGKFYGGVAALVWHPPQNRYLLLRRALSKDFAPGVWECVTGRVEQGEGFTEAVRREVQEEIGVAVSPIYILGTTHFYRGTAVPQNELLGVVYLCALTDADPEAICLSSEHDAHCWVTAAEAGVLLSADDPSTQWVWRLMAQVEGIRPLLPPALIDYYRQHGFDL